jgi:glycosyltransferase involved in cell wall biosynthesis
MLKILIIPSWYPTEKKPVEGSFFREQALAMNHLYNLKIFYPVKKQAGRLSRFFNSLLYILKITPQVEFIKCSKFDDPKIISFYYTSGIAMLDLDQRIMEWQCNVAFSKMAESGWIPDLIHAQCTVQGGLISNSISKKFNLPYIITEHNIFLMHLYSKEIQALMKSALENAKLVLSVSEHQKRTILMNGIDCHPVVVGNMVDENIFYLSPERPEIFTILYITFNHYIKDNTTFFKAVKLFKQKARGPFKIKFLGRSIDPYQPDSFAVLADSYGLKDDIEIDEYVGRDRISDYYHNSDVLISTSIAETFGLSMCEALFCGIPIISTANGGVDDIINDKNGIKVKIQDELAVCDALLKVFNKEIVFDPLEIRNTVINKFSKGVFIKNMDRIYCSAIEKTEFGGIKFLD